MEQQQWAFMPPNGTVAIQQVGAADLSPAVPQETIPLLPNAITFVGYSLGLWWVFGGPAWSAVASVLLDEVDGAVARARGETSEFGSTFDWASDIVLTALSLQRVKAGWAIPGATVAQVYLRSRGIRPPLGSLRAAIMIAAVLRGKSGR